MKTEGSRHALKRNHEPGTHLLHRRADVGNPEQNS
jgi:hypothetical protein